MVKMVVVVPAKQVVGALSVFNPLLGQSPFSLFAWNSFSLPSKMRKYSIASCIILLYLLCVTHGNAPFRKNRYGIGIKNNEFDVLIFTQRWPLTACFEWENKSRINETHTCSLPKHEEWTIHGIWPTKYNTIGPTFCYTGLPFNSRTLAPIESELKENWIDIQNGSKPYSFWKHEWEKHGTCAITVKALNNEFKYFQIALKLLEEYHMTDILAKANILPGDKYMVQDILVRLQRILNKRGQIMCVRNKRTKESYINEIRICFNKTLQLTNCDGIYHFPTNCVKSKEIIYPSRVPRYHVTQT